MSKQASNNLSTSKKAENVVTTQIAVTKGIDANKVAAVKIDLNSPRWNIKPDEKTQTVMGIVTTPDMLIHAAVGVEETAKKLQNQRGLLAAHLFNIARECDSLYEFEAFMIQLGYEAGWKTYPEQVRNYKSRIVTHWKNGDMPMPGDEVMLPKLDTKGQAIPADKGGKLVKRPFRNLLEYYDYCKDEKQAKTQPKESPAKSAAPVEGVTVTPAATITTTADGATEVEAEADQFTMLLGRLQVLYAQADTTERQKMVKRMASLEKDIRKSQDTRFASEEKSKAAS